MTFYLLALVPLLFPLVVKVIFHTSINYWEWGLQTFIGVIVLFGLYSAGNYMQFSDIELWNGRVTEKTVKRQNCPIGWVDYADGFCQHYTTRSVRTGTQTCSGSGNDRRCTDDYKTQYNYYYPWEQNWLVHSNIGKSWTIARVDAQGAAEPLRWAEVNIGDPVSKTNSYINYVRASASSLFNKDARLAEQYKEIIPEYPIDIYDYYKVDRVITTLEIEIDNISEYNTKLSKALSILGPERQANAVILITSITDKLFGDAVINAWRGAKKNDIIIIIGVDNSTNLNIKWLKIYSWSKNKLFDVELRDSILDVGNIQNPELLINNLKSITLEHFERQSMAEFEYLKDEIEPSTTSLIFI